MNMIKKSASKKHIFSIAFIYILGSFFSQGLKFIALPIFSKILPVSDFGLYSSFETWLALITVLIGLQATASIANAYIDFGKEKIFSYTYVISILGIITALLFMIFLTIFRNQCESFFEISYNALMCGIVQCIFTYFFTLLMNQYRMLEKPFKYLFFSIGSSFLSIVVSIIIINSIFNNKYLGRVYGSTIASICFGIIAVIIIIKNNGKNKINIEYLKYAVRLCVPLIFHAFATIILNRCDQIMILKFKSSTEAGIYSYGSNFSHIIYVLYTACNQAYLPWYYKKLSENDTDEINKTTQNYIKIFSYIFIMFISSLPTIIKIISSETYYQSIYIAPILSLSFYFSFLYTFPVNYEFYKKKTKYIALGTVFSACVNAILNYFLIPYLGRVRCCYRYSNIIFYVIMGTLICS